MAYEIYTYDEALVDQAGNGSVLTFKFTLTVPKLIWVLSQGGNARASVNKNITPTDNLGIPCLDGVPTPITIESNYINIYAAVGPTVSVWGFG